MLNDSCHADIWCAWHTDLFRAWWLLPAFDRKKVHLVAIFHEGMMSENSFLLSFFTKDG